MKRVLIVTAVAVGQLALAGVAVFPQLSARVAGDTYQMRVMPVDPIDPFRGAYVALDYPDLRRDDSEEFGDAWSSPDDGEQGDLFITLAQRGDVWVGADWTRERPESGPPRGSPTPANPRGLVWPGPQGNVRRRCRRRR